MERTRLTLKPDHLADLAVLWRDVRYLLMHVSQYNREYQSAERTQLPSIASPGSKRSTCLPPLSASDPTVPNLEKV